MAGDDPDGQWEEDNDEDWGPPGTVEDERRRLWSGPTPEEQSRQEPAGIDRIEASCAGNAATVLARTREVLDIVLAHIEGAWPADEAWRAMLPPWFVAQCREEGESEELHPLRAQMYSLPPDQWFPFWLAHKDEWPPRQVEENTDFRWSVGGFTHWFRPQERQWWWWDTEVRDPDRLVVRVVPFDLQYAWGALEWLLYTAGAVRSESIYGFSRQLPDRGDEP